MAQLERMEHASPAEFVMLLCFGMVALLAGTAAFGSSPQFLGHNLSCMMLYVWVRRVHVAVRCTGFMSCHGIILG